MEDKEASRKIGEAIVVCTNPDVCKSPTAPVPYSIVSYFDKSSATTPTVRMTAVEGFTLASQIDTVVGDEPGVGKGVVSGTHAGGGVSKPVGSSSTVRAEKNLVVRHDDPFTMNSGNTRGKVVYVKHAPKAVGPDGKPVEDPNPPVKPETPPEKRWYEKAWDGVKEGGRQVGGFGRGVGEAGWETVQGVGSMAKGGWNLTGGWYFDPEAASGTWSGLKNTTSTVWNQPGVVWDSIKEPYQREWAQGNYGAALGRGTFEVVSTVVGTKGLDKLGKGAKLGNVADKLGDVGRVGDKLGDAGRIGDKLGDAGRVGDKLGDAGKVGDKVGDAGKTGDALGDAGKAGDKAADASKADDASKAKPKEPKDNDGVRVTKKMTRKEAEDWWRKNHKEWDPETKSFKEMSDKQLASHMDGIDWSKPVEMKTLPAGTEIEQWQRVGGRPGAWGAEPGSTMDSLAINGDRVPVRYTLDQPMDVISSRAAPFQGGNIPGVGGAGGGVQYQLPDGWMSGVTRR